MEWLEANLHFNSSAAKEGLVLFGERVYSGFLDNIAIPLGTCLLRNAESAVKYSLNGDYQRFEEATTESVHSALSFLQLSQFQTKLIWEFFVIILGNSFFVLIAWRWYGERIRSKFMINGRRNMEDMRISHSELKLPREMDFKFK